MRFVLLRWASSTPAGLGIGVNLEKIQSNFSKNLMKFLEKIDDIFKKFKLRIESKIQFITYNTYGN